MTVAKKSGLNFTSGAISFSDIRRIFVENTSQPISFSQVYRNTSPTAEDPIVPDADENLNVPTSGTIDASDFRNTIKAITVEQSGTDLNLNINDYISLFDTDNLGKNIRKNFVIKGTVASNDRTKHAAGISTTSTLRNFAIVNDGNIYGASGQGASSSNVATSGGDALYVRNYVKVINNGNIWAGGGGGGRGADGGKGGNGGDGQYATFINKQCTSFISKQCSNFINKQCTSFVNKQCSTFVSKQCTTSVTTQKDQGSASSFGISSCDTACSNKNSGATCQSGCKSTFVLQQNGKMQGGYTSYYCAKCVKSVTTQQAYDCSFQQAYDCSFQQTYDCSFQQAYDCSYQQSYDCSFQQVTYTTGGSGGSKGTGGSGGRGRGYDYQSPNSLSGSSGTSNGTGSSGGTNAGKGGDGTSGGAGGSGGDWGEAGSGGTSSTKGGDGQDGNRTTGATGEAAGAVTPGAAAGNYINGISYSTLVNNSSVKGNTNN